MSHYLELDDVDGFGEAIADHGGGPQELVEDALVLYRALSNSDEMVALQRLEDDAECPYCEREVRPRNTEDHLSKCDTYQRHVELEYRRKQGD